MLQLFGAIVELCKCEFKLKCELKLFERSCPS